MAKVKSNTVVTTERDEVTGVITFEVLKGAADGQSNAKFLFDPKRVGEANIPRFLFNGIKQRVVDTAALDKDKASGKPPTPQDKADRIKRIVDHYMSGSEEWSPARVDGGLVLDGVLLAAVAEAVGLDLDAARARVVKGAEAKGVTPKEYLANAAASKRVVDIVARMRAERSGLDAEDTLAEMEMDEEGEGDDEPTEEDSQ